VSDDPSGPLGLKRLKTSGKAEIRLDSLLCLVDTLVSGVQGAFALGAKPR